MLRCQLFARFDQNFDRHKTSTAASSKPFRISHNATIIVNESHLLDELQREAYVHFVCLRHVFSNLYCCNSSVFVIKCVLRS
uniref:Uncharacterized protein n=1 Tax=Glossina morsitans morsitans TaxID=37546 RepID=A0A1B0G388_GLOMM